MRPKLSGVKLSNSNGTADAIGRREVLKLQYVTHITGNTNNSAGWQIHNVVLKTIQGLTSTTI